MGQYYRIANLDKKEVLSPHNFGEGAKLLEFGCSSGGMMTGLAVLLATSNGRGGGDLHPRGKHEYTAPGKKPKVDKEYIESSKKIKKVAGRWAGDRIAIVGDYADKENPKEFAEAYSYEEAGYTDISALVIEALCQDSYIAKGFEENTSYQSMVVSKS